MKRRIPIFFATDDNYVPYLAVAIRSIDDNGTEGNIYDVKILTDGLSAENESRLRSMHLEHTEIEVVNVDNAVRAHRRGIRSRLRDYYSESIFYRIFIASLFPELKRAIYIDCDVVLVSDIADMYDTDIGDSILGVVSDESIPSVAEFCDYVESWVGVRTERYFNSGVLLMNLEAFRDERIESSITELISRFDFDTVAPDQDYLNFLCKDKVCYLDLAWNKQPKPENPVPASELKLIHYNMFNKPWKYSGVLYEEEFWKYAARTPYFGDIRRIRGEYTDVARERDIEGAKRLIANAARLARTEGGFASLLLRIGERT